MVNLPKTGMQDDEYISTPVWLFTGTFSNTAEGYRPSDADTQQSRNKTLLGQLGDVFLVLDARDGSIVQGL